MNAQSEPRWASIDTAASHLDINARTVRRWITEGRITGYRVGLRIIRVDLNEVEALLKPLS